MALDMTSFDAALKQHYTDAAVEDLVYKDNPFLALVPKYEQFGGRNLPIVIKYGHGGGRSATFSVAQTNSSNALKIEDFLLTRVKDYCVATIDSETIEASKGDPNAFMEAATAQIDGAIGTLTRALARDLYRAGWGTLGVIGSVDTDTITLDEPGDVVNFEVGDVCVFADSESGDTLRNSGTGLTVESVNRSAGTVTFTASLASESAVAGDYVFTKGDRQDSATPTRLKIAGVEAWCPASAPSSTAFFGVDRTADSRLYGLSYAPSAGTPLDEVLITAAARVGREGGRLTHFLMSFEKLAELTKILGSKAQYVDMKVGNVGFTAIRVLTGKGAVDVVADHNCPANRIFGVDMSSWKLYSLGKAVRVIDTDGQTMLRQASADGVEVRYGFKGNLGCNAPCHNINIQISDS